MQTTTLEFVYSSCCLSLFCVVAFLLSSKLIDTNMYYPRLTEHFKWQHYGNFIVKFRNISVLYQAHSDLAISMSEMVFSFFSG